MSDKPNPDKNYIITLHEYNALQTQIENIQNMVLRHENRAAISNELLDISAQLRNIIIAQRQH